MDDRIRKALDTDRVIDITTTGRRSGEPSRVEIWFHKVDGRIFITGTPGPRDWYANVLENPAFTFHLKESVQADLAAKARPVTDLDEKRTCLVPILDRLERQDDMDRWVRDSPLIEVEFDEV